MFLFFYLLLLECSILCLRNIISLIFYHLVWSIIFDTNFALIYIMCRSIFQMTIKKMILDLCKKETLFNRFLTRICRLPLHARCSRKQKRKKKSTKNINATKSIKIAVLVYNSVFLLICGPLFNFFLADLGFFTLVVFAVESASARNGFT